VVSAVSVGALFLPAALPGLMMAGGFIAVCWSKGCPPEADAKLDLRRLSRLTLLVSPDLVLPILSCWRGASASRCPPKSR